MIQVGDKLPATVLHEYVEVASGTCSIGPNPVDVAAQSQGKKLVIFGLPGAFTPTCSAKHVPGYVMLADEFKRSGVDEIWCISVNDAFVMGAWAREEKSLGKVRMLGDGSADFTKAAGLTLDLSKAGLGLRSQRYAMVVDNGIVKSLAVESSAGALEVSSAQAVLDTLKSLK